MNNSGKRPRPLAGTRVLDLSQVLAGPYCGMILAGLGAEVIKIEAPEGDISRSMGPPFVDGSGALFLSVNRNKKSLVLDLKRPEGQAALHRLARKADVLIHNFRPAAARNLRVDHPTLSRVNPRLIYASVAAFGHSGPWADRPGLDAVLQAMGGLMSLTGPARGAACKAASSIVDVTTGILTALGIVATLFERRRTRRGGRVGAALLDSVLALQASLFTYSSLIGRELERVGNGSYFTITDCFATRDGALVISLPTSRFWWRLCRSLKAQALDKDIRFATHSSRIKNKGALGRRLAKIFRRKSTSEWIQILSREEVPCGPVLSYSEVIREPQVRHNGLMKMDRYGKKAVYRVIRSPVRLNGFLMDGNDPSPRLGQDSDQVLASAGFTPKLIRKLRDSLVTVPQPVDLSGSERLGRRPPKGGTLNRFEMNLQFRHW